LAFTAFHSKEGARRRFEMWAICPMHGNGFGQKGERGEKEGAARLQGSWCVLFLREPSGAQIRVTHLGGVSV